MTANVEAVAGLVLLLVGAVLGGGGLWAWHQHGRPMPLNRNSMFFWRGVFLGGLLLAMGSYYLVTSFAEGASDGPAGVLVAVDNQCQVDVEARLAPDPSANQNSAVGFVRIESRTVGRLPTELSNLASRVVEVRAAKAAGASITTPASEVIRLVGELCPTP